MTPLPAHKVLGSGISSSASPSGTQGVAIPIRRGVEPTDDNAKQGGHLNPTSKALLAATQLLETKRNAGGQDTVAGNIARVVYDLAYERPKHDQLFVPEEVHQNAPQGEGIGDEGDRTAEEDPCQVGDSSKRVRRWDSPDSGVTVRHVTIGSINAVIAIGGVCDSTDSRVNFDRQVYAALVAATYARELLLALPQRDVTEMLPWTEGTVHTGQQTTQCAVQESEN